VNITLLKARGPHEQFYACDGNTIFLNIVASPARGGGYTLRQISTKSVILSQKIQLIEVLAIFFCDFFSCRITCARVATHAIFAACWRRDNFQKNRITIASKKSLVWPQLYMALTKASLKPPQTRKKCCEKIKMLTQHFSLFLGDLYDVLTSLSNIANTEQNTCEPM